MLDRRPPKNICGPVKLKFGFMRSGGLKPAKNKVSREQCIIRAPLTLREPSPTHFPTVEAKK